MDGVLFKKKLSAHWQDPGKGGGEDKESLMDKKISAFLWLHAKTVTMQGKESQQTCKAKQILADTDVISNKSWPVIWL